MVLELPILALEDDIDICYLYIAEMNLPHQIEKKRVGLNKVRKK